MTADPRARRRVTLTGAALALAGVVALIAVGVVAVSTLRNSNEGVAPDTDDRTVFAFPDTPNLAIGVVDDFDRLTSLAIATLSPDGVGGSIVTIPVSVDATNGFGPEREPISRQPFEPGSEDAEARLLAELEPLLTLTVLDAAILSPADLADLVDPFTPVTVQSPQRVEDSDTPGSGFVLGFGERSVDTEQLVAAFTAISIDESSYEQHDVDVALWTALAGAIRPSDATVDRDEFGRPVRPESADELLDRLFAGDIDVRDLAIDPSAASAVDNAADVDFVILNRDDALLVFGAISPGLVSTPLDALTFELVVAFTEDEVAVLGDDLDGTPITKAALARRLIGDFIFGGANVRSIVLTDAPETVPDTTTLVVNDLSLEEGARSVSDFFFSDAVVREGATVTDGIDVQVLLGDDFLDLRADQLAFERAIAEEEAAEDIAEGDGDGGADFDVADVEAGSTESATDAPAEGDTVEADG